MTPRKETPIATRQAVINMRENGMRGTEIAMKMDSSLWIFGYGSLIWNPGFEYTTSRKGYVVGWARRLYQGNTYHRGDQKLPGRVATLIKDENSIANGVVFRVDGKSAISSALKHLHEREIENGYKFQKVPVRLRIYNRDVLVLALTCVADKQNELYLGPDDVSKMAREIVIARGCAGPNCEYVLKLAEHVRKLFPDDDDDHLYELEQYIKIAKVQEIAD